MVRGKQDEIFVVDPVVYGVVFEPAAAHAVDVG